jgi:hypothetical protein
MMSSAPKTKNVMAAPILMTRSGRRAPSGGPQLLRHQLAHVAPLGDEADAGAEEERVHDGRPR